jgi:hypothetical protein
VHEADKSSGLPCPFRAQSPTRFPVFGQCALGLNGPNGQKPKNRAKRPELSPHLVRAPASNGRRGLARDTRAAHHCATLHRPTIDFDYPPTKLLNLSARLVESFCLKECHSLPRRILSSLSFLQRAFVVLDLPYSSYPEHWLPGSFFFLSILYYS